ncbi:MAG: LacI family DNA-binding transcriptional regulator [Lachnospirales bacterium]
MKKVTIKDIAEKAKVSKSSVSNYLNNKHNMMSETTKGRIENAIFDLEYMPNEKFRNYKKSKFGIIGLIIPDITDSFYANLSKGVFEAGYEEGFNVIMSNTDKNILREREYIKSFENKIDGLVVSSVDYFGLYLKNISNRIPIVLAERNIKERGFDLISSDNYEIIQELLSYFLARGFNYFVLFSEEKKDGVSRNIRIEAYNNFIKINNLQSSSRIIEGNLSNEAFFAKELLEISRIKQKRKVIIGVNGNNHNWKIAWRLIKIVISTYLKMII